MIRRFALAVALALPAVTLAASGPSLVQRGVPSQITNPADLRAFYCGSRVLLERRDPYRAEPLRSCEHQAAAVYGLEMYQGLVLAAPLPPFALLGFAPLAVLPFTVASPVFFVLVIIAIAASIILMRRMSGLPLWLVACAFLATDAYNSIPNGQIVPLVVLALCASAFAQRIGCFRLAAVFAAMTLIEPHIGLPACLTLFWWSPPTRRTLVLAGVLLAALSAGWVGLPVVREYVTEVLPSHARSQVSDFVIQYSLTALVYALGGSQKVALAAGSVSYLVMLAVGVWLAGRLAQRLGDEASLVLTPPAFAVIGGVYIHLHQMAVAVPLALALLARARARAQVWIAAALLCILIPWESLSQVPVLQAHFEGRAPPGTLAARWVAPAPGDVLAETAETAFSEAGGYARDPRTTPELIAFKLPTWFGLIALAAGAAALALRSGSERVAYEPTNNKPLASLARPR
jgi:hypothetical protein